MPKKKENNVVIFFFFFFFFFCFNLNNENVYARGIRNRRRWTYLFFSLSSSSTSSSSSLVCSGRVQRIIFSFRFNLHKKSNSKNEAKALLIRATENEEDEYMFKPTANAGGKGVDRNNPLLEEKFAIIGDGEYEYVFVLYSNLLCHLFLCVLSALRTSNEREIPPPSLYHN